MSNYVFAPMPSSPGHNNTFVTWENGFSLEELNKIETYCDQNLEVDKATIAGAEKNDEYSETRKSKTGWITATSDTSWFYDKMAYIARQLNSQFYNFDLYGFSEDMQYTIYDSNGDHYDWHVDSGNTIVPRKLSMTLQLSDSDSYEGGELQFMDSKNIKSAHKERGLVVAFPSFRLHRVTPVTSGIRKSIVVWIAGPSFK